MNQYNLHHHTPECLHCKTKESVSRVRGKLIYPQLKRLHKRWYWLCNCGAYCGSHQASGAPLGHPADRQTRLARQRAHAAFDPLWKDSAMTRNEAYIWMQSAMGLPEKLCHISMFTKKQCDSLVTKVGLYTSRNISEKTKSFIDSDDIL